MGRGTARAAPRSSDRAPTYWRKVLRHPRRVDLAGVRFEAGQELGVDLVLHGPPVEIQSTRRLLRSEEHTSELQSLRHLVCRLLLEKKNKKYVHTYNRRICV